MATRRSEVNRELLVKLVSDIREASYMVKTLISKSFSDLGLYERLALRYLLIELVEASAAICVHLLRSLRGIEAEGYPQCFLKMGELDLIPMNLAEKLARAARLRNLLVHRYWVIDDRKLYESIKKGLLDFEEYARIVEEAMEG